MMRPHVLMAIVLLACLLSVVLMRADSTYAAEDSVRLVVIYASGWNSENTGSDWKLDWNDIRTGISEAAREKNAVPIVEEPFSYSASPGKWAACDTNQPVSTSASLLENQATILLNRYRNARLLVVGHSLGGAVATYWLASRSGHEGIGARLDATEVVTLDSPVRGLDWADWDNLLIDKTGLRKKGFYNSIGHELFRVLNCNNSAIPYDLDKSWNPNHINDVVSSMAKAAKMDNYHSAASLNDLAIHFQTALLSAKDSKRLNSGLGPGFGACSSLSTLEQLIDAATHGAWSAAKMTECMFYGSHGAVLHDPATQSWVKGIALHLLDKHVPGNLPASPTPTLQFSPTPTNTLPPFVCIGGRSCDTPGPSAPPPPTNVRNGNPAYINVTWDHSGAADGFRVYVALSSCSLGPARVAQVTASERSRFVSWDDAQRALPSSSGCSGWRIGVSAFGSGGESEIAWAPPFGDGPSSANTPTPPVLTGVSPTPTPTPTRTQTPTPTPTATQRPADPPPTVSIRTDRTTYNIGDPIQVCYSVSRPGHVRITDFATSGATTVVLDGIDDGRGDCIGGTIEPPPGTETVRIEFIDSNGRVLASDDANFTIRGTTSPPGGVWRTVPPEGSKIDSFLEVTAEAYPANVPGAAAIDHVDFTFWWPQLGPEGGPWQVACRVSTPVSGDLYYCAMPLTSAWAPCGVIKISFDVYDKAGNHNLAPNGTRTYYSNRSCAQ